LTQEPTPPGPQGRRSSGCLREYGKDTLGFLVRCSREYGDVVAYRLGHQRACLLTHPLDIEQVLVSDFKKLPKGLVADRRGVLQVLLGEGLLTADGEEWMRRRRIARPAFAREQMARQALQISDATERTLARWNDGETRDLHHEMTYLAVCVVGDVFLSLDVRPLFEEINQAVEDAMKEHSARLLRPGWLPGRVPTPGKLRFRKSMRRFETAIRRIIDERRSEGRIGDDLLSDWLGGRSNGAGLDDETKVRDEIATLFLAGHDTTALALSWTWHLLAQNPQAERRLTHELDSVLKGRPPGLEDLRRLPYLERVLQEALRLYPSSWGFSRICLEEYEVGGYRIPAGTSILMSPWVTQRDPRFFDEPESFRPERWENGLAARLPKFAYFPFGGGPRGCIGYAFGMMEAALILATTAQRFRFEPEPGYSVEPWASITLRPRHGVKMIVRRR
jgi:cytochrome P450